MKKSKVDFAKGSGNSESRTVDSALTVARASGEANFERKIRAAFGKAMGNDMARAGMRGDTSLDASTRLNRLLNRR